MYALGGGERNHHRSSRNKSKDPRCWSGWCTLSPCLSQRRVLSFAENAPVLRKPWRYPSNVRPLTQTLSSHHKDLMMKKRIILIISDKKRVEESYHGRWPFVNEQCNRSGRESGQDSSVRIGSDGRGQKPWPSSSSLALRWAVQWS